MYINLIWHRVHCSPYEVEVIDYSGAPAKELHVSISLDFKLHLTTTGSVNPHKTRNRPNLWCQTDSGDGPSLAPLCMTILVYFLPFNYIVYFYYCYYYYLFKNTIVLWLLWQTHFPICGTINEYWFRFWYWIIIKLVMETQIYQTWFDLNINTVYRYNYHSCHL